MIKLKRHRRRRGSHARNTPLLRQLGFGRFRAHQENTPASTAAALPAPPKRPALLPAEPRPVAPPVADRAGEMRARSVVIARCGLLMPLDWTYGDGTATAQIPPGLMAAEDLLGRYATALGVPVREEPDADAGWRRLVATGVVDGVTVTVWARLPARPSIPAAPAQDDRPGPEPIERLALAATRPTEAMPQIDLDQQDEQDAPEPAAEDAREDDTSEDEEEDDYPAVMTNPLPVLGGMR